jgi:hypothetical protein
MTSKRSFWKGFSYPCLSSVRSSMHVSIPSMKSPNSSAYYQTSGRFFAQSSEKIENSSSSELRSILSLTKLPYRATIDTVLRSLNAAGLNRGVDKRTNNPFITPDDITCVLQDWKVSQFLIRLPPFVNGRLFVDEMKAKNGGVLYDITTPLYIDSLSSYEAFVNAFNFTRVLRGDGTVLLSNLPKHIVPDDIYEFLKGFELAKPTPLPSNHNSSHNNNNIEISSNNASNLPSSKLLQNEWNVRIPGRSYISPVSSSSNSSHHVSPFVPAVAFLDSSIGGVTLATPGSNSSSFSQHTPNRHGGFPNSSTCSAVLIRFSSPREASRFLRMKVSSPVRFVTSRQDEGHADFTVNIDPSPLSWNW